MTHAHGSITTSLGALRRLVVALLAVALVASACGGDGGFDEATEAAGAADAADDASTTDAETEFDAPAPVIEDRAEDSVEEQAEEEESMEAADEAPVVAEADESLQETEDASGGAADTVEAGSAAAGAVDEEDGFDDRAEAETADGDDEGLFADPADVEDDEEFNAPPDPARLEDNRFQFYGYREFIDAAGDPLSTFALDVDTGSYTVARRWLDEGVLPPPEAVRVEEFLNAFDYDYNTPQRGLEITVDGGPSPFSAERHLVRVGVQAQAIPEGERPPVALTFIIDTSGSMDQDNRLGLVKESLAVLVDELDDDDTVAIVVYSSSSGVLLEPTRVADSRRIYDAIDSLQAGGSTNLELGLREGYELAAQAFRSDGVNRVIIASDGVANAGITDQVQLNDYIRGYADEGIHLVTIGYGMGNFNDTLMEQLANNGDGFYAYVDTLDEAERLFETELTSTLITAAIDAKIQVEFDPEIVEDYRLIGFENRGVRDDDFRNDNVDAGELGAGHQVTAMYEVLLREGVTLEDRGDIGEVFLRWEDPEDREVIEIDEDIDLRDVVPTFAEAAIDFQLATVVTAFGEVLRDNPYADEVDLSNVWVEASRLAERMDSEQVDELVAMLNLAQNLG